MTYKITVVLHDGGSIEAERSSHEGARLFEESVKRWGIQHERRLRTPEHVKEITIVESTVTTGGTSGSKPRSKGSPRKSSSKGSGTKD